MRHAIRITSDRDAASQQIFQWMLKYRCAVDFGSDGVFIVPDEILSELGRNGTSYEPVTLTEEQAQTAQILAMLDRP
jgi:hypothetical protein